MHISFDSRTYLLSKIKSNKRQGKENISYFAKKFLGEGTGPQEFLTNLIIEINKFKKINTSFNFLSSDIHLLNLGFYSPLWNYLYLKDPKRVIIRFDGVGIDNSKNPKQTKKSLETILKKGNFIVFQSEFCRSFFKNEFGFLPNNNVIYNGAYKCLSLKDHNLKKLKERLSVPIEEEYFVVAGRFTGRKRIKETINCISNLKKYNLVVLSNVPKNEKIFNKRIKYIGFKGSYLANQIICNSKALIHMDRYDWCPNIVVSAIANKVPVICSNYGASSELVKNNGVIVNEYPKDTPHNLEGIKFVNQSKFPEELFYEALINIRNKVIYDGISNKFDIKVCAKNYFKTFNKYLNLNLK